MRMDMHSVLYNTNRGTKEMTPHLSIGVKPFLFCESHKNAPSSGNGKASRTVCCPLFAFLSFYW